VPSLEGRRAHWRNLVNTIEPSVCGGDAALCQITLTTCYYSITIVINDVLIIVSLNVNKKAVLSQGTTARCGTLVYRKFAPNLRATQ